MGLQSSDLVLVERSNTLYKETYGNRANIDSSDLILVQRGSTLYRCTYANLSSATGTDLILVQRGSTLYKETQSDWAFPTANVDIHSANYAIPSSQLTFTYGNGNNLATDFSTFEVQIEVTDSGSSSTGHLYIGVHNTASTNYYGDLPIGGVQILQSNGTTFRTNSYVDCDWNFALGNVASGYNEWTTTDSSQGSTGVITNETLNPGDPNNGFYFYTIGSSDTGGQRRFSYTTTGTPSTNVGAAQGISTSYYPANAQEGAGFEIGTENIPQDTAAADGGYLYQEMSSSTTGGGDIVWLNAPEATNGDAVLTLYNGDRIRVAYYGGSNGQNSTNGLQTSNCIYLRWHEEN